MPKRKTKMTDEEALKHYQPAGEWPAPSSRDVDADLTDLAKKLLDKARGARPEFVKPELAVDRVMSNRKSAVIKNKNRRKK